MSDKKLQFKDLSNSFLFFNVLIISFALYSWFNYSMVFFAVILAIYVFITYSIIVIYITIRNRMFIRRKIHLGLAGFGGSRAYSGRISVDREEVSSFTELDTPELLGEKKVDLDPVIFKINEYITLKLENNRTKIYINNEEFIQCKYLLINIVKEDIIIYDEVESIDEAVSIDEAIYDLDSSLENDLICEYKITPKQEFIAHCSNIQAWVENDYNTKILHRNLAFPLLRRLVGVGDEKAKIVFREDIVSRYISGNSAVREYLHCERYLNYLRIDDIIFLVREVLEKERKIDLSIRLNTFIDDPHDISIVDELPPSQDPIWRNNVDEDEFTEEEFDLVVGQSHENNNEDGENVT